MCCFSKCLGGAQCLATIEQDPWVTDQKLGVELALVVAVRGEALAKAWAEVPDVVWAKAWAEVPDVVWAKAWAGVPDAVWGKAWAAELATGVVGKRHKKLIQTL